ncbi:MAG: hypothetical protein AAGE43_04785 [Pseudomonadota bacterium]
MTDVNDMGKTRTDSGRLWQATAIAFLVAMILLFTVVLPAEFDRDPLGTGELLGLTGLSRTGPTAVTESNAAHAIDRIRFELAPFESVEYKFRMAADSGLVFSWMATGELVYDMHAEPDGAEEGYAESFQQSRGTEGHGTYLAPFSGIHGWFWENRGDETVFVELHASGFTDRATEFRDGDAVSQRLEPVQPSTP